MYLCAYVNISIYGMYTPCGIPAYLVVHLVHRVHRVKGDGDVQQAVVVPHQEDLAILGLVCGPEGHGLHLLAAATAAEVVGVCVGRVRGGGAPWDDAVAP